MANPFAPEDQTGFISGNLQKAAGSFGQMAGGALGLFGDLIGSESIKQYGLGAAEGAQMFNRDVNSRMNGFLHNNLRKGTLLGKQVVGGIGRFAGAEQFGKEWIDEAKLEQQQLEAKDPSLQWKDVDGIGEGLQFVGENVLKMAPLAAGTIVGGLGAAMAAPALGLTGASATALAAAGAFLPSLAVETGLISSEIDQVDGNRGHILTAATPAAALDAIPALGQMKLSGLSRIAKNIGYDLIGETAKESAEQAVKRSVFEKTARGAAGIGAGALSEAATESAQSPLEAWGAKKQVFKDGQQYSDDILKNTIGALTGGMVGGENYTPEMQDEIKESFFAGGAAGLGISTGGKVVSVAADKFLNKDKNPASVTPIAPLVQEGNAEIDPVQSVLASGQDQVQGIANKFSEDVASGTQSASLLDGTATLEEQKRKQSDGQLKEAVSGQANLDIAGLLSQIPPSLFSDVDSANARAGYKTLKPFVTEDQENRLMQMVDEGHPAAEEILDFLRKPDDVGRRSASNHPWFKNTVKKYDEYQRYYDAVVKHNRMLREEEDVKEALQWNSVDQFEVGHDDIADFGSFEEALMFKKEMYQNALDDGEIDPSAPKPSWYSEGSSTASSLINSPLGISSDRVADEQALGQENISTSIPEVIQAAAAEYKADPVEFHGVVQKIYSTAKNYAHFVGQMVKQFGESIKTYAKAMWDSLKSFAMDERGLVGSDINAKGEQKRLQAITELSDRFGADFDIEEFFYEHPEIHSVNKDDFESLSGSELSSVIDSAIQTFGRWANEDGDNDYLAFNRELQKQGLHIKPVASATSSSQQPLPNIDYNQIDPKYIGFFKNNDLDYKRPFKVIAPNVTWETDKTFIDEDGVEDVYRVKGEDVKYAYLSGNDLYGASVTLVTNTGERFNVEMDEEEIGMYLKNYSSKDTSKKASEQQPIPTPAPQPKTAPQASSGASTAQVSKYEEGVDDPRRDRRIADAVYSPMDDEDTLDAKRAKRFEEIERLKHDSEYETEEEDDDPLEAFGVDSDEDQIDMGEPVKKATRRNQEDDISVIEERNAAHPDHPEYDGKTQRLVDIADYKFNKSGPKGHQTEEQTKKELFDKEKRLSDMFFNETIYEELEAMDTLSEREEEKTSSKTIAAGSHGKNSSYKGESAAADEALIAAKEYVRDELISIFKKIGKFYDLRSVYKNLKEQINNKPLALLDSVPDYLIGLSEAVDAVGKPKEYEHQGLDEQQENTKQFAKDLMDGQNPIGIKKNTPLAAAILNNPAKALEALSEIIDAVMTGIPKQDKSGEYGKNVEWHPTKKNIDDLNAVPVGTIRAALRELYGKKVNDATASFLTNFLQLALEGRVPTDIRGASVDADLSNRARGMKDRQYEVMRARYANDLVVKENKFGFFVRNKEGNVRQFKTEDEAWSYVDKVSGREKPETPVAPTREETIERNKIAIAAVKSSKLILSKILGQITSKIGSTSYLDKAKLVKEIAKTKELYKLTTEEVGKVVTAVLQSLNMNVGEHNETKKFTKVYRNEYGLAERIDNRDGAMRPIEYEPVDAENVFDEQLDIFRSEDFQDVYKVSLSTTKDGNTRTREYELTKDDLKDKIDAFKEKGIKTSYKFVADEETGEPIVKRVQVFNNFFSKKQLKRMQYRLEELGLIENDETVYGEDGKVDYPMYMKYADKLVQYDLRRKNPLLFREKDQPAYDNTEVEKADVVMYKDGKKQSVKTLVDQYPLEDMPQKEKQEVKKESDVSKTFRPKPPKIANKVETVAKNAGDLSSTEGMVKAKDNAVKNKEKPSDPSFDTVDIQSEGTVPAKDATAKERAGKLDESFEETEKVNKVSVGRFKNSAVQKVFEALANVFGAELVVTSEDRQKTGKYYPKGKNGKPTIVLNANSMYSTTRIFGHELFHHLANKISPDSYKLLSAAIKKSVDQDVYDRVLLNIKKESEFKFGRPFDQEGNRIESIESKYEDELHADLFAEAIRSPQFWKELVRTDNGKSLARTLLLRIAETISKVMNVLSSITKQDSSRIEIQKLVKEWYGKDGLYNTFASMMLEAYQSDSLRNSEVRDFDIKNEAKVLGKEAVDLAKEKAGNINDVVKKVIPKNSLAYKEWMASIEKIVKGTKDWLIAHKPKGIYADMGAAPIDVYLASKVAFDVNHEMHKAFKAIEGFKELWKDMKDTDLELMHDKVVRKGKLDDLTAEQKEAFEAYKQIADGVWEKLKLVYPNLPKRESHFGQSLKWFHQNGIPVEESIDDEKSRLLGNDRFSKMKSHESTREIAESKNLKYETINPHELLLNYVRDAYKQIKLHEMLTEALEEGRAKTFSSKSEAKREGFFEVDDAAMKIMQEMTVVEGYAITKSGKEVVDDNSLDPVTFGTEEEAQNYIDEHAIEGAEVKQNTNSVRHETGKYYFKQDLANMLNTLVSRDALRNGELFGISGHTVMNVKNKMTAIEMALSMFHAMTIGHEFNSSTLAYNLQNPEGNKWLSALKGENIFQNLKEAKEAVALLNEMSPQTAPERMELIKNRLKKLLRTDSDEVVNVLEYYYRTGGEQGMDKGLRSDVHSKGEMKYGSWKEIKGSVKDVFDKEVRNNPDKRMQAYWSAFEFSILEAPTAWLMEKGIPMLKLALFSKEFMFELGKEEKKLGRKLTEKEKFAVSRRTMTFVEDRMGEVNWTGQFMLPSVKTALQFAFRSFTWVSGNMIALGKSANAFTQYGWEKAKGNKEAKLSPYGYWGLAAIFNHFLVVGIISSIYALANIGDDEVESDPETPFITKALFPRISGSDPQKRLSIPTYVTESYKILSHLGLISGQTADTSKLISGRFNSLVSNAFDVYRNEDWRGTTIRNSDDNIVKQLIDVAAHMAVVPISFSTVAKHYKETGDVAVPLAVGLAGMTDAPASAKRSAATNKAYELRRKEYKGKETTEEKMEEKEALKRAMNAYAKGDKSKIDELVAEGRVSQKQYQMAVERVPLINGKPNPKYKNQLSQAISGLTIEGALKVWEDMSENEKIKHKPEIFKKYSNMLARKDKPDVEKKAVKEKMRELKIIS